MIIERIWQLSKTRRAQITATALIGVHTRTPMVHEALGWMDGASIHYGRGDNESNIKAKVESVEQINNFMKYIFCCSIHWHLRVETVENIFYQPICSTCSIHHQGMGDREQQVYLGSKLYYQPGEQLVEAAVAGLQTGCHGGVSYMPEWEEKYSRGLLLRVTSRRILFMFFSIIVILWTTDELNIKKSREDFVDQLAELALEYQINRICFRGRLKNKISYIVFLCVQ